eukprot:GILK01012253.1.p1 GENE.GILK01012253.1~~GILK01012253.1.p1  ORF type:complete len:1590 (-),score=316.33 GILK01012253.1:70-4416(-)
MDSVSCQLTQPVESSKLDSPSKSMSKQFELNSNSKSAVESYEAVYSMAVSTLTEDRLSMDAIHNAFHHKSSQLTQAEKSAQRLTRWSVLDDYMLNKRNIYRSALKLVVYHDLEWLQSDIKEARAKLRETRIELGRQHDVGAERQALQRRTTSPVKVFASSQMSPSKARVWLAGGSQDSKHFKCINPIYDNDARRQRSYAEKLAESEKSRSTAAWEGSKFKIVLLESLLKRQTLKLMFLKVRYVALYSRYISRWVSIRFTEEQLLESSLCFNGWKQCRVQLSAQLQRRRQLEKKLDVIRLSTTFKCFKQYLQKHRAKRQLHRLCKSMAAIQPCWKTFNAIRHYALKRMHRKRQLQLARAWSNQRKEVWSMVGWREEIKLRMLTRLTVSSLSNGSSSERMDLRWSKSTLRNESLQSINATLQLLKHELGRRIRSELHAIPRVSSAVPPSSLRFNVKRSIQQLVHSGHRIISESVQHPSPLNGSSVKRNPGSSREVRHESMSRPYLVAPALKPVSVEMSGSRQSKTPSPRRIREYVPLPMTLSRSHSVPNLPATVSVTVPRSIPSVPAARPSAVECVARLQHSASVGALQSLKVGPQTAGYAVIRDSFSRFVGGSVQQAVASDSHAMLTPIQPSNRQRSGTVGSPVRPRTAPVAVAPVPFTTVASSSKSSYNLTASPPTLRSADAPVPSFIQRVRHHAMKKTSTAMFTANGWRLNWQTGSGSNQPPQLIQDLCSSIRSLHSQCLQYSKLAGQLRPIVPSLSSQPKVSARPLTVTFSGWRLRYNEKTLNVNLEVWVAIHTGRRFLSLTREYIHERRKVEEHSANHHRKRLLGVAFNGWIETKRSDEIRKANLVDFAYKRKVFKTWFKLMIDRAQFLLNYMTAQQFFRSHLSRRAYSLWRLLLLLKKRNQKKLVLAEMHNKIRIRKGPFSTWRDKVASKRLLKRVFQLSMELWEDKIEGTSHAANFQLMQGVMGAWKQRLFKTELSRDRRVQRNTARSFRRIKSQFKSFCSWVKFYRRCSKLKSIRHHSRLLLQKRIFAVICQFNDEANQVIRSSFHQIMKSLQHRCVQYWHERVIEDRIVKSIVSKKFFQAWSELIQDMNWITPWRHHKTSLFKLTFNALKMYVRHRIQSRTAKRFSSFLCLRRSMNRLGFYRNLQRQKQHMSRLAADLAVKMEVNRAVNRWKARMNQFRRTQAELNKGVNHHRLRICSRVWNSWKIYFVSRKKERIDRQKADLYRRFKQEQKRKRFQAQFNLPGGPQSFVLPIAMEEMRLVMRILHAWKLFTQERVLRELALVRTRTTARIRRIRRCVQAWSSVTPSLYRRASLFTSRLTDQFNQDIKASKINDPSALVRMPNLKKVQQSDHKVESVHDINGLMSKIRKQFQHELLSEGIVPENFKHPSNQDDQSPVHFDSGTKGLSVCLDSSSSSFVLPPAVEWLSEWRRQMHADRHLHL